MHPSIVRPTPAPAAPAAAPATARRAQHRAPGRGLPARRAPRAVELDDTGAAEVLTSVLAGLRAVPDVPHVDLRTRLRDLAHDLVARLDLPGTLLVAKAGAVAAVVFTAVLLLWLAAAGRLG
ncbi:hypothetical protein [Kineococcus sp. SYSU DK002]|uniref:hypothetical protein n=1 Tax=Kineococcus sp. SYSU DK002 TaxID=3383123 RepID=UPI003D7E8224